MRVLTGIVNRDESRTAFEMLKESIQKGAKQFPDHLIGWQGGSRRHTVYWLPKFGFWAVLEASPPDTKKGRRHRFWSCFGVGNPAKQNLLTITVEINPPHEGEDPRVAGLFVRDADGRIYMAHTGKVGGGRVGIGQNAFRKYLGDDRWDEIQMRRGTKTAVVLGPIKAPDFGDQVAKFVHDVADFKEGISNRFASKSVLSKSKKRKEKRKR